MLKQMLLRPKAYRYYRRLMKNQFCSPDEITELNWAKRRLLLVHAFENIPYYRKRFESAGFSPHDMSGPEDWHSVPFLTKNDLREHLNDIVYPGSRKRDRAVSTTGGSTGEPVRVYSDKRFPREALGWRMLSWWGLKPGTDIAIAYRLLKKTRFKRLVNKAIWWPTRRLWLDASSMDIRSVENFVRRFNALKPPLLYGYGGAVRHVAQFVEENGLDVHSPQVVWVTSSPVSAVERSLMERVFRSQVYDQYGSGEMSWIAAECREHSGLHIFSDARYVEFLDDENKPCPAGKEGRIVVTNLEDYVFPIIRYEIEDRGKRIGVSCNCGVNLPLMAPVRGRIADSLPLPDGSAISGEYLTTIFDEYPMAVRAYQVYQHADYSITVKVVPNQEYADSTSVVEKIRAALSEKVRNQVPVNTQLVSEILSDQGKTRFVISEITGMRSNSMSVNGP
jgi:phenylacetate-CoA ligase